MAARVAPAPSTAAPPEPVFAEIADALERKGQAILFGPPGTGKTYAARRFAVYWLLRRLGAPDAADVLADPRRFEQAERSLAAGQPTRKVWWAVSNPREWSWDTLFSEGEVTYRFGRLRKNYALAQPGDLVIGYESGPSRRVVALARVAAALGRHGDGEAGIRLAPVARVRGGPSYDELLVNPTLAASEPIRLRNQGTLFSLTADEADHALALLAEREPEIAALAGEAAGPGSLTHLTFHPSYSYEDFVEGFRPVDAGDGALALRLEDGVFKRVCREAQAHPDRPFLVLADEINRANLGKVFGELVTLLEADKRGLAVTLPQSKERFAIPANVFLIGTMNTADRSIKLLDAALRRRFAFVEFAPDPGLLRGVSVGPLALDDFLEELNRRVTRALGRERRLGHSYLLAGGRPIADAEAFAERFRHEILPLLQEYCYEDFAALAGLLGDELVDADAQELRAEALAPAGRLLEALAREFNRAEGEER
jgi:5-methylcytosine-specific restriction protein B